jgi:hypothetical protein
MNSSLLLTIGAISVANHWKCFFVNAILQFSLVQIFTLPYIWLKWIGNMMSEKLFTSNLIKQFKARRTELGLQQKDVDYKIGNGHGLCAKWEIGNRKPTLFNAYCWAEALGCEIKLEIVKDDMRN